MKTFELRAIVFFYSRGPSCLLRGIIVEGHRRVRVCHRCGSHYAVSISIARSGTPVPTHLSRIIDISRPMRNIYLAIGFKVCDLLLRSRSSIDDLAPEFCNVSSSLTPCTMEYHMYATITARRGNMLKTGVGRLCSCVFLAITGLAMQYKERRSYAYSTFRSAASSPCFYGALQVTLSNKHERSLPYSRLAQPVNALPYPDPLPVLMRV